MSDYKGNICSHFLSVLCYVKHLICHIIELFCELCFFTPENVQSYYITDNTEFQELDA